MNLGPDDCHQTPDLPQSQSPLLLQAPGLPLKTEDHAPKAPSLGQNYHDSRKRDPTSLSLGGGAGHGGHWTAWQGKFTLMRLHGGGGGDPCITKQHPISVRCS